MDVHDVLVYVLFGPESSRTRLTIYNENDTYICSRTRFKRYTTITTCRVIIKTNEAMASTVSHEQRGISFQAMYVPSYSYDSSLLVFIYRSVIPRLVRGGQREKEKALCTLILKGPFSAVSINNLE